MNIKRVTSGGAANLIPASGSRVVVTNLGNKNLTDPSNRVAAGNSAITDALLGTGGAGDPTRDEVLSFINNVDVVDANGNNSTYQPPPKPPLPPGQGTQVDQLA